MSLCCLKLVTSKIFSYFTFTLIFVDCNLLIWNLTLPNTELFISIFYLTEMVLKMISFGLFFDRTSYFRNKWNFLDFFIVLNLFFNRFLMWFFQIDISYLQNLIVLRLLKIPSFQRMSDKLFYTFEALSETFFIFMFFIVISAILSLQLFSGSLKYQCIDSFSGLSRLDIVEVCYSTDFCQTIYNADLICLKTIANPNHGLTNFDNVFYSFLVIFKIISLDNWTDVLLILQNAFNQFIWIYVLLIIIIGNFFLLNIMLAVLKVKFTEQQPSALIDSYLEKYREKCFDLKEMKKEGLFKRKAKIKEEIKVGFFQPWMSLKTLNLKNLFSIKRIKLRSIDGLMKKLGGTKKMTTKQSLNLKKILDKKKDTLLNSLSIKFKATNFEIRVKKNDKYESDSLLDVIPNMYIQYFFINMAYFKKI